MCCASLGCNGGTLVCLKENLIIWLSNTSNNGRNVVREHQEDKEKWTGGMDTELMWNGVCFSAFEQ